jgi:hypothetical protein
MFGMVGSLLLVRHDRIEEVLGIEPVHVDLLTGYPANRDQRGGEDFVRLGATADFNADTEPR